MLVTLSDPDTPTGPSFQTLTPDELETFWAVWVMPGVVDSVPETPIMPALHTWSGIPLGVPWTDAVTPVEKLPTVTVPDTFCVAGKLLTET